MRIFIISLKKILMELHVDDCTESLLCNWSGLPLHDCIMKAFYISLYFSIYLDFTLLTALVMLYVFFFFQIEFINICAQSTDQLNIFGLVYKRNNTLKRCSPSSVLGKSHWCYKTFQYHFSTCYPDFAELKSMIAYNLI